MTAEGHMKQRCVTKFLHAEKIAPNDIHWRSLNVYRDQMDVSTVRQWVARFSSGDSAGKEKPCSGWPCTAVTPQNEEHLDQLICANQQIMTRELCTELNISFSALKRWWQPWNIAKFALGGSHECLHRNIKNTVCKFVRTYWTSTRLKVTVSWIASSLVMRRGVTTMSRRQNGSPWSGNMWIPHWRKCSRRCPQRVKWCALSSGIGKGWSFWISLNPDKPSTLTATLRHWISWRLEFPESGQRRGQPFSCNMITPGLIPVWRPWITLSNLAVLSYHTHHIVWIWRLLTSISSGRWKMDCMGNIFLATVSSYELWNSGPPPLVQIFTSAACRLLFIAGERA